MKTKVTKVSDGESAVSEQRLIQTAAPYKHYGLSTNDDRNDDRVPTWMDDALKYKPRVVDVKQFDGIWP